MKLVFDEGGMERDFNALCDPPDDWRALDPDDELGMFIWFRAYWTGYEFSEKEQRFAAAGYEYDCLVEVEFDGGGYVNEIELAAFPARDTKEAERLLQVAADALYGKESDA